LCEIVARKTARVVAQRKCDDQDHADDRRAEPDHGDEHAIAVAITGPTAGDQEDDFDRAARCAVEERLLGRVAEADDELREEVGDAAWIVD